LFAFGILISSLTSPTFAAVKAGTPCTKLNQTQVSAGYTYTCIKSGKKLVWSKGVKVATPTPSQTASASPIPVPTPSATPTPQPSPSLTPEPSASPTPTISNPAKPTYFKQWIPCTSAQTGHSQWVIGLKADGKTYVFLQCRNSTDDKGLPVVIWQIPQDAASIDQATLQPVQGTGFIPPIVSSELKETDWMSYSATNHPQEPSSFSDLYQYRNGISYLAWSKLIEAEKISKSSLPEAEIFIGPKTHPYNPDAKSVLEKVQGIFEGSPRVTRISIIYFSVGDLGWATEKAQALLGATEWQKAFAFEGGPLVDCYLKTDCNNANSWATPDGSVYLFIGVPNQGYDRDLSAGKEVSEYFHSIYLSFYSRIGAILPLQAGKGLNALNQPPYWMSIGGEEIPYFLTSSGGDFVRFKTFLTSNWNFDPKDIPSFDSTWLNSYLDLSNLGNFWSNNRLGSANNIAETMGPRLMEIFIALKGPGEILSIQSQMSRGVSFDRAFENDFGVSWSSAQPEIIKVLLDEYNYQY